jgi:hypothetical protein
MNLPKIIPLLIKKADEPIMAPEITPENGLQVMALKFAHHQLRKRKIMEALKLYREHR